MINFFSDIKEYSNKIIGNETQNTTNTQNNKLIKRINILFTALFAFIGILLISIIDNFFLDKNFKVNGTSFSILTGAYAATSVLIYDDFAIKSPLAQPKNVIGSYTLASFIGVSTRIICEYLSLDTYISGPLAVSLALIIMNIIDVLHPPGGACALIAVIGNTNIKNMGYYYVLTSFCGSLLLVIVAILTNNLIKNRTYPSNGYSILPIN